MWYSEKTKKIRLIGRVSTVQSISLTVTTFSQALVYLDVNLTFDKLKDTAINQETNTVDTMVGKITGFLIDALSVVLNAADLKALKATIQTTFTDLKLASQTGFASFSKNEDKHNSSWEYRILFAVPNPKPDNANNFYALVTTILLEADIVEEKSWWGFARHHFEELRRQNHCNPARCQ
jgi:hypothetical protein